MGKLRHIALYTEDIEATASFYQKVFSMERVRQLDYVITLSDGLVSLAIVDASKSRNGSRGLDHIGFLVDDMEAAAAKLEASGSVHCGQISKTIDQTNTDIERKYRAPDGLVFDIVTSEHARPVWGLQV